MYYSTNLGFLEEATVANFLGDPPESSYTGDVEGQRAVVQRTVTHINVLDSRRAQIQQQISDMDAAEQARKAREASEWRRREAEASARAGKRIVYVKPIERNISFEVARANMFKNLSEVARQKREAEQRLAVEQAALRRAQSEAQARAEAQARKEAWDRARAAGAAEALREQQSARRQLSPEEIRSAEISAGLREQEAVAKERESRESNALSITGDLEPWEGLVNLARSKQTPISKLRDEEERETRARRMVEGFNFSLPTTVHMAQEE